MEKTQSISFPRSGHHLLVNALLKYYSGHIDFPSIDGTKTTTQCRETITAGKLTYCEYYHHCRSIPCTNPQTTFQKNHDFDLDVEVNKATKHIIQYRHPLESITSLYEGFYKDKVDWRDFCLEKLKYWVKFIDKWVSSENKSNPNFIMLPYHRLINNMDEELEKVINFIDPTSTIDYPLMKSVLGRMKGKTLRDLNSSGRYDTDFLAKLEKMELEKILQLQIKPIFNK